MKLHTDDRKLFEKFIDYVRLNRSRPENWKLEYYTRITAECYGIHADVSNSVLSNRIAKVLESKQLV